MANVTFKAVNAKTDIPTTSTTGDIILSADGAMSWYKNDGSRVDVAGTSSVINNNITQNVYGAQRVHQALIGYSTVSLLLSKSSSASTTPLFEHKNSSTDSYHRLDVRKGSS